jgi:predicted NAD/FAD-binding protein
LKPLRIAVVGSGISGLSAGWLLSQHHDVTLFEAGDRVGGHSNTVTCHAAEGPIAIDTGFIVYNQACYPNLVALFDYLDVPTSETTMGFGVSLDGGRVEYSGDTAATMIGHAGNVFDPDHWQMLLGIVRFFRTASARAATQPDDMSLAEFLQHENYSKAFIARHLLPMAGAIWSSEPQQMLDYPVKAFLRFFDNHGLLQFGKRPPWRTVVGGSVEYVQRLLADSRMTAKLNHRVERLVRRSSQCELQFASQPAAQFDHVVLATHADQALALLGDGATSDERNILSDFGYSTNRVILHRDPKFMPQRRRLWSSWNHQSTSRHDGSSVTYWMNALQPLATRQDYFVTVNPQVEPQADLIEATFIYQHPIFTAQAIQAQKKLWGLQGAERTWFCGAHFGSGFHEDGLQSGLAVAEELGGLLRPWQVADQSSRIHVTSPARAFPSATARAKVD